MADRLTSVELVNNGERVQFIEQWVTEHHSSTEEYRLAGSDRLMVMHRPQLHPYTITVTAHTPEDVARLTAYYDSIFKKD